MGCVRNMPRDHMTHGLPMDSVEAAPCLGRSCTQAAWLLPDNFRGSMSTGGHASLADIATPCKSGPRAMCLALFRAPGSPAGPCAAAKPFVMLSCFLSWLSWRATAESGSPAICCRRPFDLPCARTHASNQQILERHSVSLLDFALQHASEVARILSISCTPLRTKDGFQQEMTSDE